MVKAIAARSIAGSASIARHQIAVKALDVAQPPYNFPRGTWTFSPTRPGFWKFVGWADGGAGVSSGAAGDSSGYFEITRFIGSGKSAALVVGATTSVTFANGNVATVTGKVASGGDVNLAGSTGGDNAGSNGGAGLGTGGGAAGIGNGVDRGGGAGAPANLPFRGGDGGSTSGTDYGGSPGAGTAMPTVSNRPGGGGMIICVFVRD